MVTRVISAAVLIAMIIVSLLIGKTAFFVIAFLINTIGLYEFANVVDSKTDKFTPTKIIYIIIGTLPLILAYFNSRAVAYFIPVMLMMTSILFILSKKYKSDYTVYSLFGLVYLSTTLAYMVGLLKQLESREGLGIIMFAVLIAVVTDSFAYIFGVTLGKHKLCPAISPKKSIEGSVGGFLSAIVAGIILYFVYSRFNIVDLSFIDCLVLAVIDSILCQFGDLTASMVKRNFDVKDYGNLIPGHGGILDRIDGILFSLAGTLFYVSVVIGLISI